MDNGKSTGERKKSLKKKPPPRIIIDEMYCKGCGICVQYCPEKILEISDSVNRRGYYAPRVTDAARCTRCRNCDLYCPDFAIFIVEDEEHDGE
jgi:2-oxoglutarate ferredoxin oxidoreductase subunit delta